MKMSWETDLKGKLTQPVIAGGMVYVVSIDKHTVHALDEASGRQAWDYTAGARVDSAVTYDKGKILFGSADGHVYCLSAHNGDLIWKYRMAPEHRHIVAHDQLESAWPLHGAVLIHDGKAVVIAGRSSYLDGGLQMALLDPETGKVDRVARLDTTGLRFSTGKAPGALRDILVAKGDSLYIHFSRLSLEGTEIRIQDAFSILTDGGPGRARGIKKESLFLTGTGGMLHDGIFHRSGMMYGKSWGQIMALDQDAAYSVQLFKSWGNHNGPTFKPGRDKSILVKTDPSKEDRIWTVTLPLIARAIITSGDHVILGGAPEAIDPKDPWQRFEGRGPGRILFHAKRDGSLIGACDLPSVPVHDGVSAANNTIFVSMRNGRLQCWR
jgi:hypothetical protein